VNHTILYLASVGFAFLQNLFWVVSVIITLHGGGSRRGVAVWLNRVWLYTKYPALVGVFAQPVFTVVLGEKLDMWDWAACAAGFLVWVMNRDVGDDDWKKKFKKKLKEKIAVIQGKLVVVPQPS
jgi:hypothetical protein